MQTTSATWKRLWAAGAPLEARATIAGTVYTQISAPVIHRAAMQERLSVGNVAAASLLVSVRGGLAIPRSAAVVIEARLNDGTTASEWLPQGTFYVSRRARDPVTGVVALECYDALLKANAVWTPSQGSWPRTMTAVAAELLALLGLELDSRTAIPSGAAFVMGEPAAGTTLRDALGIIAQAGGGNWVVTPAGKLRLVPVVDASNAEGAEDDVVDVEGVIGAMDAGPAGTITGVRCTAEGEVTLTGDDSGAVVDVSVAPVIAVEAADLLIGRRYQAYRLTGAVCDPAAELGDWVRAGANGEVRSALYSQQITLGPACRSDIAAPEAGELTDEYPYIGSDAKALALAKAYADRAVDALDSDLDQQEVFDRLTDGGAAQGLVLYNGQLYVNASFINAGFLNANRIQGGTLTLGGANNVNGLLRVVDGSGNVIGTWNKDGITLNKGAISGPSVTLGGSGNVNGQLQVMDASGTVISTMNNTGIDILRGSIHNFASDGYFYNALEAGGLRFYVNMGKLEHGDDRWERIGGMTGGLRGSIPEFKYSGIGLGSDARLSLSANEDLRIYTTGSSSDRKILIYTNSYPGAQIELSGNSVSIDGNTAFSGTVTASAFSGPLTGDVTGNCSGTAANVTGTVEIGHGGTGATTAADARMKLGIIRGRTGLTFSNGVATKEFSHFGASSRPTALILTPTSETVIMRYDYGNSASQICINAVKPDGTGYSGSLAFSWICIV